MSDQTPDVQEFLSLDPELRTEVLRILGVLQLERWSGSMRFFAPGPRGGYILQFLRPECAHTEAGARCRHACHPWGRVSAWHDLDCFEAIECYIEYSDPDTGEFFPFYPVDPILRRGQLQAILRLSKNTFNDVAPDIEGRLQCWCVCAATGPFVRQLFADPDHPWPTKADRRHMRAQRKAGMRPERRHR